MESPESVFVVVWIWKGVGISCFVVSLMDVGGFLGLMVVLNILTRRVSLALMEM